MTKNHDMGTFGIAATAGLGLVLLLGCATTPKTTSQQQALLREAETTVQTMTAQDPGLREVLDRSAGYAVFPSIGKGGLVVGGAYGRGVAYQDGKPVGYVDLTQATVGAQLGAQTYAELIVFQDRRALGKLQGGEFMLTGQASAVAIEPGAAASAEFGEEGVAVFVMPRGGLMVELSVGGQQIDYEPIS